MSKSPRLSLWADCESDEDDEEEEEEEEERGRGGGAEGVEDDDDDVGSRRLRRYEAIFVDLCSCGSLCSVSLVD